MLKKQLQITRKDPLCSSAASRQLQNECNLGEAHDSVGFEAQVGPYTKFNLSTVFQTLPSIIPTYDISQHIAQFNQKLRNIYQLNSLKQKLAVNPQQLVDNILGHYDPALLISQQNILQGWMRETQLQSDLILQYIMIDKILEQNLFNQFYNSIQFIHLTRQNEILKRQIFKANNEQRNQYLQPFELLNILKVQFEIDCDFKLDEKVFVQKVGAKTQLIIEKLLNNTRYVGQVLDDFEPQSEDAQELEQRQLALQMALQGRYNQLYELPADIPLEGIITLDIDTFLANTHQAQVVAAQFNEKEQIERNKKNGGTKDLNSAVDHADLGCQYILSSKLMSSSFLELIDHVSKENFLYETKANVEFFDEKLIQQYEEFATSDAASQTKGIYSKLQLNVSQQSVDFVTQRLVRGPDLRRPNTLFESLQQIQNSDLLSDFLFASVVSQVQCLDVQFLQKQARLRNTDNLHFCLDTLAITKLMMIYQEMMFNVNQIFFYLQKARCDFLDADFSFTLDLSKNQFIKDNDGNFVIFKQSFDELIFIIYQMQMKFREQRRSQSDPEQVLQQLLLLFTEENNRLLAVKELIIQLFTIFYRSTDYHHSLLFLMYMIVRQRSMTLNEQEQLKYFLVELQQYQVKDFKLQTRQKLKIFEKTSQFRDIIENIQTDHKVIVKIIFQLFVSAHFMENKSKFNSLLGSFIESCRLQLLYISKLRTLQSGQDINVQNIQDFNIKLCESTLGSGVLTCEQSRQFLSLQDNIYKTCQKMFNLQELGCVKMIFKPQKLNLDEKLMNVVGITDDKQLLERLLQNCDSTLNRLNYTQLDCFKEYGNSDFLQSFDQFDYQLVNNVGVSFVYDLVNAIGIQMSIYTDDLSKVNKLLKVIDQYLEKYQQFVYQKLTYFDQLAYTDYVLANLKVETQTFQGIVYDQEHQKELEQIYENFIPLSQKAFLTQAAQKVDTPGANHTPQVIITLINLFAEYQVMWKQQYYSKLRQTIIPQLQECQDRCEGALDKMVQAQYLEFGLDNYIQIFSLVEDTDLSKHFNAIVGQFYQRNQLFRNINCINTLQKKFDENQDHQSENDHSNQLLLSQVCGSQLQISRNNEMMELNGHPAELLRFVSGELFGDKFGHFSIPTNQAIHSLSFASVKPSSLVLQSAFDWYGVIRNIYEFILKCVNLKLFKSVQEIDLFDEDMLKNLDILQEINKQIIKKQTEHHLCLNRDFNNKIAKEMLSLVMTNEDVKIDIQLSENMVIDHLLGQFQKLQRYLSGELQHLFQVSDLQNIDALVYYQILKLYELRLFKVLKQADQCQMFDSYQHNEFEFSHFQYIPPPAQLQSLSGFLLNIQPTYRSFSLKDFDYGCGNWIQLMNYDFSLTFQNDYLEKDIQKVAIQLQKVEQVSGKDQLGRIISYQNLTMASYKLVTGLIESARTDIGQLQIGIYLRQHQVSTANGQQEDLLKVFLLQNRKNTVLQILSKKRDMQMTELVDQRKFESPQCFAQIIPGCFGFVEIEKVKELEGRQIEQQDFAFMNIQPLRALYLRLMRGSSRSPYQEISFITPFQLGAALQQFVADIYIYLKQSVNVVQDYRLFNNQFETVEYNQPAQIGSRGVDFQIGCYFLQTQMQRKLLEFNRRLNFTQNTQQMYANYFNSQTLQKLQNKQSRLMLISGNIEQYLPQASIIFQNLVKKLYSVALHSLQTVQVIVEQQNTEMKEDFLEHANQQLLSKRLTAFSKLFRHSGQQIFNELYHYEVELEKLQQNLLIEARLLRRGIGFAHLRLSELQHEIQSITDLQSSEEHRLLILKGSIEQTNARKEDKMRQTITQLTSQLAGIMTELGVLNEQLKTLAPNLSKMRKDEQQLEKAANMQLQPLSALADAVALPKQLQIDVETVSGLLRQIEADFVRREQLRNALVREKDTIVSRNQQQISVLRQKLEVTRSRRIEMVQSVNQLEAAQRQMENAKMQKLENFDLQLNDQLTILQGELNRERTAVRKLEQRLKEMKDLVKEFERETGKRLQNLFV